MTGRSEEERAAFRAFVRENHPDVGGDPEVFAAGLERFRRAGAVPPEEHSEPGEPGEPIEYVTPPGHLGRAMIRLTRWWRRKRRTRVD